MTPNRVRSPTRHFRVGRWSPEHYKRESGLSCSSEVSAASILPDRSVEIRIVGLADRRRRLVIKEGQEDVALAFGHKIGRVQQRAGEHHGGARRRLEALRAIFWKAQLAALVIVVQVQRYGKAAMRRTLGGVVAMGVEMAVLVGGVAGDDEALHAGDVELMGLGDLRHDAAQHAGLGLVHYRLVLD